MSFNGIIYQIVRLVSRVVLNTFYRINFKNVAIPDGRVVVVSNHVSFLDAIMLVAHSRRKMRFVIYEPIYRNPILKPFFKAGGCIPIASGFENKEVLVNAYSSIAAALENGEAVVIYPEGKITRTGKLNQFKNGIEKIIKRTPSDVYPIAIKGLYGSHFSRSSSKKWYGKIFAKVTFIGGDVVHPEDVTSSFLENVVRTLLNH